MDIKSELKKLWAGRKGDYSKLTKVNFNQIGMRGVKDFEIEFRHPVTAIAGANGIGKTTIIQTIACLFHCSDEGHNPYRYSTAKQQPPHYRFSDFFIISRGEDTGLGAALDFTYDYSGSDKNNFSIKKISRWSNYERRPERHVDFLGISRVLPAYEGSIFRNEFSGSFSPESVAALDDSSKTYVGTITGKGIDAVLEETSRRVKNFKLGKITSSEGLQYSSFNMGAGEEVAITLISRVSNLPQGSVVLIEEIELGLHPRAQKELIKALLRIVYTKKIQLIFTTHSPYIFSSLPDDSKVLLTKTSGNLEAIYSPSESIAFIELSGEKSKDLTIYVEDNIAKHLVENLFNSSILKRVHIIDVGSKENVVRMTSAHYINPSLGRAIGVGDGDLKDNEINIWCRKYMHKDGVELDAEALAEIRTNFFRKLPSDGSPEKYILSKVKHDDHFMQDIDDSSDFEDFIKNKINLTDPHSLFYLISEELSKDLDSTRTSILRYVSRNYRPDFSEIMGLVEEKLGLLTAA